jgi:dihydrofolate synthase/folylpolyglutamate synthase
MLPEVRESPEAVYAGCSGVRRLAGLRGRLEVIQQAPLVVADVGHNDEGLASALAYMERRTAGRLFVLLGVMRDKDVARMADRLARAGATVFPVHIDAERALPAASLGGVLQEHRVAVAGPGTVAEGLAWFQDTAVPEDALLVTGSHLVVAQLPPG